MVNGALALFNPKDASVRPTREYPNLSSSWHFSSTERDTVIAAGGDPIILHHVVHTAETADTVTTVVGTIALSNVEIEAFASGTRLLFGASSQGRVPLVYYVPSSGTIEPAIELAAAHLERVARRKDGTAIGILDSEGRLFEVTEAPRGGHLVGRVRGPLQPSDFLAWDEAGNRWKIADVTGKVTPIETAVSRGNRGDCGSHAPSPIEPGGHARALPGATVVAWPRECAGRGSRRGCLATSGEARLRSALPAPPE